MEKVGFIGACDKMNLIMYVAKSLTWMQKRVLVIDTTILQKTKYTIPSINPTKSYVSHFDGIDFAVGFDSMLELERYLEIEQKKMPYDYALIDIDSEKAIGNFEIFGGEKNYFVTTFDSYSLRKGMEILGDLSTPMKLTKVLYRYKLTREDEEYLEYLSMEYRVDWNEYSIYLPYSDEDIQTIEENQRVNKLRIKRLSGEYQDGIIFITQDILKEKNNLTIRKSIKE